jgi:YD repeat-containing protein
MKRGYGVPGGAFTKKLFYYDGDAFVGLPITQATAGLLMRTSESVTSNKTPVDSERLAYDVHGNVTALLDANSHKRRFDYDKSGLLIVREFFRWLLR